MAGDGNSDGGDEVARPRPGGSSRRKKQMRRSSWTVRRGEVVAVAAGTAIGVGEHARWRSVFAGERARGEVRERRERSRLRGVAREAQGDEREAAGSRRWLGHVRARVAHEPSSGQGEEDDRGGGGGLGRHRARPGGLHSR